MLPVKSTPMDRWEEPKSSKSLFQNDSRIFWGYWNEGQNSMPELCKQAVLSWQVRNPEWKVIIMDDENYHQYVSMSDLPTTFSSLKVQHKSDILRIAVLLRYGGCYLDVSTFMYKGLNDIWNELPEQRLGLTALTRIPVTDLDVYNNSILMTRGLNNPILKAWQNRVIAYFEAPCMTKKEMKASPFFRRVKEYFEAPCTGPMRKISPYCAVLWLLTDVIGFEESLRQHALKFPFATWGFAAFCISHFVTVAKKERKKGALVESRDIGDVVCDWSPRPLRKLAFAQLSFRLKDDSDIAEKCLPNFNILKFSSVELELLVPEAITTMARILDASTDTRNFPTVQATLDGARRIRSHC